MFSRFNAQLHELRLDLRLAWLRRRERAALRRLGEELARSGAGEGSEEERRVMGEIGAALGRIQELTAERGASLDADRADLVEVAHWVKPVVVLRGGCTRLVLGHATAEVRRSLGARYEAIGVLAAASADPRSPRDREVVAIRAEIAAVAVERARRVAPFGETALPAWSARAGVEAVEFGRAVGRQLRSHFMPKAPALVGLAVGWWIANTYTDSHLRSALRSIGLGSGGTRVVSSSTYEAMSFWLPLLAAALCAYLGGRIAAFYGGRGAGEVRSGPRPGGA